MEKYTSIILAAGNQTRWTRTMVPGIHGIKQLIEVEGEVLIERIQRQFPGSTVVTKDKAIALHSKKVFVPEYNDVTVATLFSTHKLWDGWVTLLLGDVDYGTRTIKLIKGQKKQLVFYGNDKEIFAVKWAPDITPLILYGINKLIGMPGWVMRFGKLWNLYRVINNNNFKVHKIDKYFLHVTDTRDFDTQKGYEAYAKKQKIRKQNSRFLS